MESPKKRGRPKREEVSEKALARRRQRSAKRKGVSKPKGRPKKTSTQTQSQTQIVNVKIGDTPKKSTRKASGKSSGVPPASYKHNLAPIFIQPSPQPDYTELFKALQNNRSIPMESIAENTPLSTSVSQGIQTSNPLSISVSQAIRTPLSVKSEPARVKPSFVSNNFIPNDFLGRKLEDDEISELSMDDSGITMDEPAFSVKSEPIPTKTPPPLRSSQSEPKPKPSKRLPITNEEFSEFQSPLQKFGNTTGSIKGDDNSLEDSKSLEVSFKSTSSVAPSMTSSNVKSIFGAAAEEEEESVQVGRVSLGQLPKQEFSSKKKIEESLFRVNFDKLNKDKKLHQLTDRELLLLLKMDGNVKRETQIKKYYKDNPDKMNTKSFKTYDRLLEMRGKGQLPTAERDEGGVLRKPKLDFVS